MAEQKTIQQMQADLAAFRAGKTNPGSTTVPVAPVAPTPVTPAAKDLAAYRAQKSSGTATSPTIPKEDPGALASFAKGIFSAPATMVARPFQAAADLGDYIGTRIEEKNAENAGDVAGARAITSAEAQRAQERQTESTGPFGVIAPTPTDISGVKKDVGRAAQTVALGLSPISGGALFGAGASLEQGNDLLSAQTAVDAALGAGAGKVLAWVGKPLINATGKVVGTITPKIIKDVAAGGTKAIQDFAANNQLLGGVLEKPAGVLASGSRAIDDAVEGGIRSAGGAAGRVFKSQYPEASVTKHYQDVNARDIVRPTTVNEPKYAKATAVFNDAKTRGIDLEKVANERGIIHDQISEGGKYNTTDTVDNIREGAYKVSDQIARPAIKAAEPGVRLVPIKEVRTSMLEQVDNIPASQITPQDRATLRRQIAQRYADGGAADLAHPNGYSLTDLHDARIVSQKNGGYKVGQSASDALKAQRSREEGRVFSKIFDKAAPEELGMQPFKKELEKNFMLADYLEQLHGKKVPQGITKKAVRLFGRAITATVGGKVGGFPGSILGAQYGDMLFSSFEALPNPIKIKVLQSVKLEDPAAFKELVKYIGEQEAAALQRLRLPAPGETSFKETPPTIFTTPGGKSTLIKGEAVDVAAVESGRAKPPKSGRKLKDYMKQVEAAQMDEVYPSDLPTIKMGPKPKSKKSLNDIY